MCPDQVPWAINDNLAYGFAAASVIGASEDTLACACFKLTFTSTSIKGKQMIVQITNTGGGTHMTNNAFDLALPASGFGEFTEGCPSEFGSGYSWGQRYGGISNATECNDIPTSLQKGCNFRFGWYENADNPLMDFEQVVCPKEITDITGCSRTDE
ncbi:unnamed protein product [Ambrosiozyma monospora]|uniref:cellulase n=1 Tax=Ambrosiozyma monospora TaxID=43982 RepID=A0A9W7DJH4_AMBMO|nr:unnamed protein product [Ambrosiozyma monospora]